MAADVVVALLEGLEPGDGLAAQAERRGDLGPVDLESCASLYFSNGNTKLAQFGHLASPAGSSSSGRHPNAPSAKFQLSESFNCPGGTYCGHFCGGSEVIGSGEFDRWSLLRVCRIQATSAGAKWNHVIWRKEPGAPQLRRLSTAQAGLERTRYVLEFTMFGSLCGRN
jgi:hypothetical protein